MINISLTQKSPDKGKIPHNNTLENVNKCKSVKNLRYESLKFRTAKDKKPLIEISPCHAKNISNFHRYNGINDPSKYGSIVPLTRLSDLHEMQKLSRFGFGSNL